MTVRVSGSPSSSKAVLFAVPGAIIRRAFLSRIQKMYNPDRCIGCRACIEACPEKACSLTPDGIVTDPGRCTCCGNCADVCPTKATEMSGRIATVAEIVEIVEKERSFLSSRQAVSLFPVVSRCCSRTFSSPCWMNSVYAPSTGPLIPPDLPEAICCSRWQNELTSSSTT